MKLNPLTKAAIGLTAAGAAYVLVQKGRHARSRTASTGAEIHGFVQNGYEAVREAFAENFARRREIGAACCVYHKGEKVVDLWGGVRNKTTGEPWEQNTMALVYSATKGLSAMTLAVAHSRGWLDYDELVCKYWPEFAQNGKERITVRQLLAHQAGLFALDQPLDKPNARFPFGSASSFGHPGAGGSLGFADPETQIGYAYVPNRKSTTMGGDPRDVALRRALFSATAAARNSFESIA